MEEDVGEASPRQAHPGPASPRQAWLRQLAVLGAILLVTLALMAWLGPRVPAPVPAPSGGDPQGASAPAP